jgi:hypothetical protein
VVFCVGFVFHVLSFVVAYGGCYIANSSPFLMRNVQGTLLKKELFPLFLKCKKKDADLN